jgi:WD40 repeat protein
MLAEARSWLAARQAEVSPAEQAFIQASEALDARLAAELEAQRQRELAAAQQLAQEQHQRAEENAAAARRLRGRAWLLAGALLVAALLAVLALNFASQANRNYRTAQGNAQTAEANAQLASSNAQAAATAAGLAKANAQAAATAAALADANAQIAMSRQLAAQSATLLKAQPDLALLLSLEANRLADTSETQGSLLTALRANAPRAMFIWGHVGTIQAAAFSPDGTCLATVGAGGQVRLWDVTYPASGGLSIHPRGAMLAGHAVTELVNTVAFSPDGRYIVTGSDDHTARQWDVETSQPVAVLTATQFVQTAVFIPGSNTVALGGNGTELVFWDLDKHITTTVANPHDGLVWHIAASPTGDWLATGGADGQVVVWEAATRQPRLVLQTENQVSNVAFSPSGRLLAAPFNSGMIAVWEAPAGALPDTLTPTLLTTPLDSISALVFRGEDTLVARDERGQMVFLDLRTNAAAMPLVQAQPAIMGSLAVSPDRRLLVSGTSYGVLEVWDLAGWLGISRLTSFSPQTELLSLDYHPSGQSAVVSGYTGQLFHFDPATGEQLGVPWRQVWPTQPGVTGLALDPKRNRLVVSYVDGTAVLWDFESDPTGAALTTTTSLGLANAAGETALTFRRDGTWVGMGGPDGRILSVRAEDGYALLSSSHQGAVTALAYKLPIGLVSVGADGQLLIWGYNQLNQFLPLYAVVAHPEGASTLALSPQQNLVATGGRGGVVSVWSAETGAPIWTAGQAHTGAVLALGFQPSADGLLLRSVGADGRVLQWSLGISETLGVSDTLEYSGPLGYSGTLLAPQADPQVLLTAAPQVSRAALSETVVALGYADGQVQAWDVSAAPALIVQSYLPAAISALTLDARWIVAGDTQGLVRHWALPADSQAFDWRLAAPLTVGSYMVRYSPDGKLLASAGINGAIYLFDASSGELIYPPLMGENAPIRNLVFTPDGQALVTIACRNLTESPACDRGDVTVWNVSTGQVRQRFDVPLINAVALALSPDGQTLAVGGCITVEPLGSCTLAGAALWDLAAGLPLEPEFGLQAQQVRDLAFSPDGRWLATLSVTELRVWETASGQPVGQALVQPNSAGGVLTFDPTGQRIAVGWRGLDATGQTYGYVILWDVITGQQVGAPLLGLFERTIGLHFSPDGQWLLGADRLSTVLAWDLRPSIWRQIACRIANRNLSVQEWAQFFGNIPYRETCPAP